MSKNNKLIPELRFPEFKNEGEWNKKELDCFLDYLQPTPYLVKSTDYNDKYETPVLTAGKSFILGYTDEDKGIFKNNLPVIIFDDFTTASQFVDFPFKGKSSAMKILIAKNDVDIKFVYESMQMIKYQVGVHQRHWISIFSNLKVPAPKPQEQQKIAACLSSLDEVIAAHNQKLELLKEYKKGLMQNLFPQEGEKVPKLRFKEFERDGVWEEKVIGDFIKSYKSGAPLTPSDFVTNSNYEVIPKKAIGRGMWLKIEVPTYCSEDFYNLNSPSIVDNTYLITTLRDLVPSGPNIGYIVKYENKKKYILAQGVYGLKIREKLLPDFLIHFSNTKIYRNYLNSIMVGSTQVHIRNGEFFKVPINVPQNIKEQQKIALCLSSLDDVITKQAEKIEQLKQHKKGLMQGVFPKMND